jgi:hypothetical protein
VFVGTREHYSSRTAVGAGLIGESSASRDELAETIGTQTAWMEPLAKRFRVRELDQQREPPTTPLRIEPLQP